MGLPPDSHLASAAQLRPVAPATVSGTGLLPTFTTAATGCFVTVVAMTFGACLTPLIVW